MEAGHTNPTHAVVRSIGGKRLVVAAGMIRSGSTWLYNIARVLHETAGAKVYGSWVADFNSHSAREADCVVLKVHEADPTLAERADRVLTAHRDLRDVLRSASDMGWATAPEAASNMLFRATESHAFWAARADVDLKYEEVMVDPTKAAGAVSRALGLLDDDGTLARVTEAVSLLNEPSSGRSYDPVTLLHPRHRSGAPVHAWKSAVDATIVQDVERTYSDWFRRYGYDVGDAPVE